jgi:hypothetical protein
VSLVDDFFGIDTDIVEVATPLPAPAQKSSETKITKKISHTTIFYSFQTKKFSFAGKTESNPL